jgi:predicted nuclease of predicted toxin-antitoxin system
MDWEAPDDSAICQYAKANGFAIVSKDSDFHELSVLRAALRPRSFGFGLANCITSEIDNLLRAAVPVIGRFINEAEEFCLVLGPRSKT